MLKVYALRIHPGEDLKLSILDFTRKENIEAGILLSCVGSLSSAKLRMADANIVKEFNNKFEIVVLTGTLCMEGLHLHIALSDENGNMIGGHLLDGCVVYTTAEIVIGSIENTVFRRKYDGSTGFAELEIEN